MTRNRNLQNTYLLQCSIAFHNLIIELALKRVSFFHHVKINIVSSHVQERQVYRKLFRKGLALGDQHQISGLAAGAAWIQMAEDAKRLVRVTSEDVNNFRSLQEQLNKLRHTCQQCLV